MDGVRNRTVAFPQSADNAAPFRHEPQSERVYSCARNAPSPTLTPVPDWRRSLANSLWTGLFLLVAVLYSRKVAGAFERPDSALGACLVGAIALGPALLAWTLFRAAEPGKSAKAVRATTAALTVVPPLLLGAAFLPAGLSFGVWFLAALCGITFSSLLMVDTDRRSISTRQRQGTRSANLNGGRHRASEAIAFPRQPHFASTLATSFNQPLDSSIPQGPLSLPSVPKAAAETEPNGTADIDSSVDSRLRSVSDRNSDSWNTPVRASENETAEYSQQLVRSHSVERGDVLEGSVKVPFAVGQRQANVHIPFVPPFVNVPTVECEALEGCDVRLKVGTVQTFGTRIEVKRTGAIDEVDMAEIAFAAVPAQQQSHAA